MLCLKLTKSIHVYALNKEKSLFGEFVNFCKQPQTIFLTSIYIFFVFFSFPSFSYFLSLFLSLSCSSFLPSLLPILPPLPLAPFSLFLSGLCFPSSSLPPFLLLPPLFFLLCFFSSVSLSFAFTWVCWIQKHFLKSHSYILIHTSKSFTHMMALNGKPISSWLLPYVMVIPNPVLSYVNFRISLLVSTKQLAETLIWIVLNPLIKLWGIFTILSSPVYEHRMFHLLFISTLVSFIAAV